MIKLKISIITLLSTLVFIGSSYAQSIGSYGNTYVHGSAEVGVHGNMVFNNGTGTHPGIIVTNRNSQNPGVISFGENASWKNAGDSKHVDGYVKVYSDMAFTFPIGDLGMFKPLSISGAAGTMVAYSYDNPSKLPFINSTVATRAAAADEEANILISDSEYWDVRGHNPTKITLIWDTNSSLEELTNGDLANLTIVGWNGSSWKSISSSVDDNVLGTNDSKGKFTKRHSTINNGSITTNDEIVPDDFSIITFGVINSDLVENNTPEFGSELVNNEAIEFTLFPNPSVDMNQINIDYDLSEVNSDVSLMIFNALGERIYEMKMENNKSLIKLPYQENTSGLYHVGIITSNGSKVFKPVVITH